MKGFVKALKPVAFVCIIVSLIISLSGCINVYDALFYNLYSSLDGCYDDYNYPYRHVNVDTSKSTGYMFDKELSFTVGGKEVEIPCRISDLVNAGYNFSIDDIDNKVLNSYDYEYGYIYNEKDEKCIYVEFSNNYDRKIRLKDAELTSISVYSDDCIDDFKMMDDISFDSNMEDIIIKYGKDLEKNCCYRDGDIIYYEWDSINCDKTVIIGYDEAVKKITELSIYYYEDNVC